MTSSRRRQFRLAPAFWWLCLAWLWASLPVTLPLQVISAFAESAHFSHEARLREEVAALLAPGAPDAARRLSAAPASPRPAPAALPLELVLKKIQLVPVAAPLAWRHSPPKARFVLRAVLPPDDPVRELPEEPPRFARVA